MERTEATVILFGTKRSQIYMGTMSLQNFNHWRAVAEAVALSKQQV
jgi:hypothetical protein